MTPQTNPFVIAGGNDNHVQTTSQPDVESPSFDRQSLLKLYGVVLLMQETSRAELDDLDSDLPTDTHLVRYLAPDNSVCCDAVRSYSTADIFDAYHDTGATLVEIASGFGRIKPKLWVDARKED